MVKTTFYLEEKGVIRLRQTARRQERSQSAVVREAIDRFVLEMPPGGSRPAPVGVGRFRSGRTDIGTRAEELLYRARRNRGPRG